MSNTTIKCPECGGDRTVPAGPNKYSCQYCGATFVNNSAPTPPMRIAVSFCRFCGEEILPGAQKCHRCGEWQNPRVAVAAPRPVYQPTHRTHHKTSKDIVAMVLLAVGIMVLVCILLMVSLSIFDSWGDTDVNAIISPVAIMVS